MSARAEVPITPSLLEWAVEESGLSIADVAAATEVDESALRQWITGRARPSVSELRAIAAKLHRQFATFLLPAPPDEDVPRVAFREPLGGRARALNADERRYLRRASRLQSAHSWLATELQLDPPRLGVSVPDAEVAGAHFRAKLEVTLDEQLAWRSPSHAFDAWRAAVERLGVLVVQYPLGEQSCRGFSLWDARAPLIAVNTAWPDEARIFTLFHECGHLLDRGDSVCAQPRTAAPPKNRIERWCEEFAAAVLIPRAALDDVGRVTTVSHLRKLAEQFRVSLRAMALRLITADQASWRLYKSIPAAAEIKRKASGGSGRSVAEMREDEVGWRGIEVFVEATRREVISQSQALGYLDISSSDFESLAASAHLR